MYRRFVMAQTISSDLIRGNIDTIILNALIAGDRYGYEIIKEIEIKTHGLYVPKQPTLYSCLKRLENQGFIEAYWGEQASNGGRRKYYHLTETGREIFKQSKSEYVYNRTVIDSMISTEQYDLSSVSYTPSAQPEEESDDHASRDEQAPQQEILQNDLPSEEQMPQQDEQPSESIAESVVDDNLTIVQQPAEAQVLVEGESATEQQSQQQTIISQYITHTQQPEALQEIETQQSHPAATPEIHTGDFIDSLLSGDSTSYFNRGNEETAQTPTPNGTSSDSVDDIAARITALQEEYQLMAEALSREEMEAAEASDTTPSVFEDFATQSAQTVSPAVEQVSQTAENSYENGFYRYNTRHSGINSATTNQMSARDTEFLRRSLYTEASIPKNQNQSNQPLSIKEQIRVRNYGKLTESMAEMGENAKVRQHTDSKHEYNKQYFFRDRLLALHHAPIMFLMMLAELFLFYVIGKNAVGANTEYDVLVYVACLVVALALPVSAAVKYVLNPSHKKRNDTNFTNGIVFRIIVAVQLLLIVFALNICMGMPITFSSDYFVTLALPSVLVVNFPISAFVYNAMRKNTRYSIQD